PDLLVASSGGNDVLLYRGTGPGTFAEAEPIFVGTSPAGLTVADLDGDGVLDFAVANQGSNDVSVVKGAIVDGRWPPTLGPRLQSGGSGPSAVNVLNLNSDAVPDLLVTNGQSGTLQGLPGVGGGFFDDTNPQPFSTPGGPGTRPPVFAPDGRGFAVGGD